MKFNLLIYIFMICAVLTAGCNDSVTGQGENYDQGIPVMYINDPILLEASGEIKPSETHADTIIYDLSDIELFSARDYNDFDLSYITGSSCDCDGWVYNHRTQAWDRISFGPSPNQACLMVQTRQEHLFSAKGIEVRDCVDENDRLFLRGHGGAIRALAVNHKYQAVPLVMGGSAFTIHQNDIFVSRGRPATIFRVSFYGEILDEYDSPSDYPFGMASDGEYIWLADGSDRIFKLDQSMDVVCDFSVPTDFPGGLAWAEDKLWLTEYQGPDLRTLVIEPDSSCSSGAAVVERTFQTPGGKARGITFDGQNLIIISDRLYRVTLDGTVLASYELPVEYASNASWDSGTVWIMNRGPNELRSSDAVISRFRIP